MALKHLLDLNKTDRYTADGRDKINELQAKVTEDVTYKTGDISQKTGLQKQPDGSWAPPKKGGLGSGTGKKETGNKEQKRQKHIAANSEHQFEAASSTANSEIDQANLKSIKSFMDEEHATFKNALYSKAETLARRGARGTPDPENEKSLLKFAEAAGMADDLKLYLKEEVHSKYEFGDGESKPGRDFPVLKNKDHVELAEEVKSNTMPGSDWTAEEIAKEWKLGKADAEEVKKEFDKIKTESKPAESKPATQKTVSSDDIATSLDEMEKTKVKTTKNIGGVKVQFDPQTGYKVTHKAPTGKEITTGYNNLEEAHQAVMFRLNRIKNGEIPAISESAESKATDSAPRILTGDTRIRVRK